MFRPKRLIILFVVIMIAAASLVGFFRRQYAIPIIMYHSVSEKPTPDNKTNVSAAVFERQMRFLKTNHYNVVPLNVIADLLENKKRIPPRTIAITFDDGYENNYTFAYPVLKKYGLPATIFIIIDEVGRSQRDRLSWDQIRQMQSGGLIAIGSHALGPEPLINYKTQTQLRAQIFDSKRLLEEKLGRPVEIFSYPGGFFNAGIRQMVMEAGYKLAVATHPGKDHPNDDIFALKRLRISENSGNLFVFWVETSGFYNFMREHRHK